jgi:hypothetical protein
MYHPTYQCHRVPRDLTLTGLLDDPLWAEAEVAELTDAVNGTPLPQRATARLLYNEAYFFLGFQCADDYIVATHTAHDAPIWEEGCFEAFISPSGKVRQYYEVNVSPLNTVFDAFILNGTVEAETPIRRMTSFTDYTCEGLITRTAVEGALGVPGGARGWSAEYAIPFTSLIGADALTPRAGDAWRINLFHIAAHQAGTPLHYAWASLGYLDFHQPWRFGSLVFGVASGKGW